GSVARRVVHDRVQRAVAGHREVDRVRDRRLVGDVAADPLAAPAARVDLADDAVPVDVPSADDHVGAGGRARECDAAADPGAGAGHDHGTTFEDAGHGAITDPPSTMTVDPV